MTVLVNVFGRTTPMSERAEELAGVAMKAHAKREGHRKGLPVNPAILSDVRTERMRSVLKFLAAHPNALGSNIRSALKLEGYRLNDITGMMLAKGWITSERVGQWPRYNITDAGRAQIKAAGGRPAGSRYGQIRELCIEHLRRKPATIGQLSEALKVDRDSVHNAFSLLRKRGVVATDTPPGAVGVWRLTDTGQSYQGALA